MYEHAHEIRERFKYRDFTDRKWGREFRSFLCGRAWAHAEGPVALFNHAVTWLRKNRVLLPGVSVLARQVSEARTAAERQVATSGSGADLPDGDEPSGYGPLDAVPATRSTSSGSSRSGRTCSSSSGR